MGKTTYNSTIISPVQRGFFDSVTRCRSRSEPSDVYEAIGFPAICRWSSEKRATPPVCRTTRRASHRDASHLRASIQIPILKLHPSLHQKLYQLLAKRLRAMMVPLVCDISPDTRSRRGAHRERAISLLPGKRTELDLLMHPHRRSLLELPHEIRETTRGLQSDEQMDMVRHAADALRKAAESIDGAAQVLVKLITPCCIDQRRAVLGGKNDMVMQGEKRRRHIVAWLASCRDAFVRAHHTRWCRDAQPPANGWKPFGLMGRIPADG